MTKRNNNFQVPCCQTSLGTRVSFFGTEVHFNLVCQFRVDLSCECPSTHDKSCGEELVKTLSKVGNLLMDLSRAFAKHFQKLLQNTFKNFCKYF